VQQAGDVLGGDRHVAQDLQDGHGLGHVNRQRRVEEVLPSLLDAAVDRGEGPTDIPLQRVVEGDGGGQPAQRLVGHRRLVARTLDQDVLDHLDGRAQADAAGGLGQRAQQVQQDVEVGRQEGVEVGECLAVEVGVVVARVLQAGVVAQRLAVALEQLAQRLLALAGLAQQPAAADLADVVSLQVDLDREAVLELVQLR